jgi:hypothetical protein
MNNSQKTINCRLYTRKLNLKPILAKGEEKGKKQRMVTRRRHCSKIYRQEG